MGRTRSFFTLGLLGLSGFSVTRRGARCASLGLVIGLMTLAAGTSHAAQQNGRYLLGPLDVLRVKAYEWQAARNDVFEWKALNDQFAIGPEGSISLPFAGEVPAAGLDTGELGQRIADQIKQNMGFGKAPSISVEVVKFRPFYIVGDVRTPGEYPFRPELTVLQALSLAGGLYRDNGNDRHFSREMIEAKGEIRVLDVQLMQLTAQKARLESELRDETSVKFPDVLTRRKGEPIVAQMLEQEELLFRNRRRSFETELKALEELRAYLKDSIQTLKALLQTQETQLVLARKEMAGIGSLADRGLATSSRNFGLQRDVAQLEGDKLKVLNSQNQAQEELSKAEISIIALRNSRVKDFTFELRQTQARLDELAQRHKMNEQLLIESTVGVSQVRTDRRDPEMQPTFVIVRSTSGHAEELPAAENTSLEPGDTIKVILPLPQVREAGDFGSLGADVMVPEASIAKAGPDGKTGNAQ